VSTAVSVRPEARDDIEQAAAWYERQRAGLGEDFLNEVLDAFERIAEAPRTYAVLHRDTRRAVVHRFPFGVFYRIEEEAVVVFAVLHGSRDPRAWQQRS
jgi:plasmid stabilization system protein ParE